MGGSSAGSGRVLWSDLLNDSEYRGMWIALDSARYDSSGRNPVDGIVVDADEDLAALCSRIQAREQQGCSIHYCDDGGSGIRRASVT